MKKLRNYINESLIAGLLIIVLFLILNPLNTLMLSMAQMSLSIVLAVLVVLFSGLVWKESAADEREDLHKLRAGRYGYLAGLAIGIFGIIVQSIQHVPLDPWLIYVVGGMILAKLGAHILNKLRNE